MSDRVSEKQKLIDEEGVQEPPPPSYSSVNPPAAEKDASDVEDAPPSNPCLRYLYEHPSIPGYGMVKLIRGSSIYSLYVLLILLMAYLLNQLDRYTLPIVTTQAGYDLNYGDVVCMTNTQASAEDFDALNISSSVKKICSSESYMDEYYNRTFNVK